MLYKGFIIKPVYLDQVFDKKGALKRSHFTVKHEHSHTPLGNYKTLKQAKLSIQDFYVYYENLQRS